MSELPVRGPEELPAVLATGGYRIQATAEIPEGTRDISDEVCEAPGRPRILPAAVWARYSRFERLKFCHLNGVYSVPTVELVDHLREVIGGRRAIEIGAGNGVLAEALGIPATDSFQQEMPQYRATYESIGVPLVRYGRGVIRADAATAVRTLCPQVVIGCWVTHKYEPGRHVLGGNEIGVDEDALVAVVEDYVHVGNALVHHRKPIKRWTYEELRPDWLISRASSEAPNVIWRWRGEGWRGEGAMR